MVRIKLRGDGWFDIENYSEIELIQQLYETKQMLKSKLTELSDKNLDHKSLEEALHEIDVKIPFKGTPYLVGFFIMIDTNVRSGKVYLGCLTD